MSLNILKSSLNDIINKIAPRLPYRKHVFHHKYDLHQKLGKYIDANEISEKPEKKASVYFEFETVKK